MAAESTSLLFLPGLLICPQDHAGFHGIIYAWRISLCLPPRAGESVRSKPVSQQNKPVSTAVRRGKRSFYSRAFWKDLDAVVVSGTRASGGCWSQCSPPPACTHRGARALDLGSRPATLAQVLNSQPRGPYVRHASCVQSQSASLGAVWDRFGCNHHPWHLIYPTNSCLLPTRLLKKRLWYSLALFWWGWHLFLCLKDAFSSKGKCVHWKRFRGRAKEQSSMTTSKLSITSSGRVSVLLRTRDSAGRLTCNISNLRRKVESGGLVMQSSQQRPAAGAQPAPLSRRGRMRVSGRSFHAEEPGKVTLALCWLSVQVKYQDDDV